jgi:hypothetical protein
MSFLESVFPYLDIILSFVGFVAVPAFGFLMIMVI